MGLEIFKGLQDGILDDRTTGVSTSVVALLWENEQGDTSRTILLEKDLQMVAYTILKRIRERQDYSPPEKRKS